MFLDNGVVTITSVPTNFTRAGDLPQNTNPAGGGTNHSLTVYWGRFSDVGSGPYVFTKSASDYVTGRSAAVQDCVTTGDPFEAADGNTTASSVTTAPLVSASSTGADRYAFYVATNWTGGGWTPPTGYTERWDANDRTITIADLQLPTAATTSPQAVSAGSNRSNAWVGILLPVPGGASAAPSGISASASPGTPAVALNLSTAPSGIAATAAAGTPTATLLSAAPSGIGAAAACGTPTVALSLSAAPSGIAVPVAVGTPNAVAGVASPNGVPVSVTLGTPSTTIPSAAPSGIAAAAAAGTSTVVLNRSAAPTGVAATASTGQPTAALTLTTAPSGVAAPLSLGTPSAALLAAFPNGLALAAGVGTPTVAVSLTTTPTGLAVTIALGSPIASQTQGPRVHRPFTGTVDRPDAGLVTRP